jgi:hypothetical protein
MNKALKEFYAEALEKRLFSAKSKTLLIQGGAIYHILASENESRASCFCGMLCDPGISIKWDMPAKDFNPCPDCVRAYTKTFMQANNIKYAEIIYTLQKQADTSPLGMALIALLVRWHEIRSKKRIRPKRAKPLRKTRKRV